jgi:hypothetical protein
VPWVTTTEVDRFLTEAGRFLENDAVANHALLTESRFWSRLPGAADAGLFGWWVEGGDPGAAFVHLPDHAVICSRLSRAPAAGLVGALPDARALDVEVADVEAVTDAFAGQGRVLQPSADMTLLRLMAPIRVRALPVGRPRPAEPADLPVLRAWFKLFQQLHPGDRSHVAFVIDQPLDDGGVTVWETRGRPVAMASRTPQVAGMVRMGLAFQPSDGTAYAAAAFDAACADAARAAGTVLVLSSTPEDTATYTSLGFVTVLHRSVLQGA